MSLSAERHFLPITEFVLIPRKFDCRTTRRWQTSNCTVRSLRKNCQKCASCRRSINWPTHLWAVVGVCPRMPSIYGNWPKMNSQWMTMMATTCRNQLQKLQWMVMLRASNSWTRTQSFVQRRQRTVFSNRTTICTERFHRFQTFSVFSAQVLFINLNNQVSQNNLTVKNEVSNLHKYAYNDAPAVCTGLSVHDLNIATVGEDGRQATWHFPHVKFYTNCVSFNLQRQHFIELRTCSKNVQKYRQLRHHMRFVCESQRGIHPNIFLFAV